MQNNLSSIWLIIIFIFLMSCSASDVVHIQIANTTVFAELAITPEQHAKGLMFRESLDSAAGMLFVFSKPQLLSFWMKNTNIPLDMIFLDENKTVVQIETAVPCVQDSCPNYGGAVAKYVLEVNAGYSEEHNIFVGTTAFFSVT